MLRGTALDSLSFDDVLLIPQKSVLEKRRDADLTTKFTNWSKLEIPILSANMPSVTGPEMAIAMWRAGGYGFLHRFCDIEQAKRLSNIIQSMAGVSLGIHDGLDRYDVLSDIGVDTFLVDVAHAHSEAVFRFVEKLVKRREAGQAIIVGNVCTGVAVRELQELGVDAIKVGIGPGAACSTRTVSGAGRGQLTAISNCAEEATVPLIADGGIKNSGDIVKALAAGASTVMIGRLLAGCDESPFPGAYWGNASHRMNGHQAPEGVEGHVPLTGSLEDTLKPLLWGLRSGISYCGARSVLELHKTAVFERVAPGVVMESSTRLEEV